MYNNYNINLGLDISSTNHNQTDQYSLLDQPNNIILNSRFTSAETIHSHNNQNESEQNFHSNRMFVLSTLQSWGMRMGNITFSKDNQQTLKCILDLIAQKYKDIQYKNKVKEQINLIQFEKEKYQSLLKQAKNQMLQKQKILGRVQNQNFQLKKKIKNIESVMKKQKIQDNKVIGLLKSKNQQILHQVKKKQTEINRIKEQMKKSIITGGNTKVNQSISKQHKQTISVKNSFQIIEKVSNKSLKINKNQKTKRQSFETNNNNYGQYDNFEERLSFLVDKYEKEKKVFVNQNILLRSKLFEIRQILVKFAEYIDLELYGIQDEKKIYHNKKFIINHNMLFNQNCLTNDLNEVIQQAKNGISQLQSQLQENIIQNNSPNKVSKSSKKILMPSFNSDELLNMKKKSISSSSQNTANLQIIKSDKQKSIRNSGYIQNNNNNYINQKNTNINNRVQFKVPPQINRKTEQPKSSIDIRNDFQISALDNDLLSDIYDREDIDNSIISHISTSELEKQAKKYDKWDILFMNDQ